MPTRGATPKRSPLSASKTRPPADRIAEEASVVELRAAPRLCATVRPSGAKATPAASTYRANGDAASGTYLADARVFFGASVWTSQRVTSSASLVTKECAPRAEANAPSGRGSGTRRMGAAGRLRCGDIEIDFGACEQLPIGEPDGLFNRVWPGEDERRSARGRRSERRRVRRVRVGPRRSWGVAVGTSEERCRNNRAPHPPRRGAPHECRDRHNEVDVLALVATKKVHGGVVRDAKEPGAELHWLGHLGERVERLGERVLHEVLAVDDIAHHAGAVAMKLGPDLADELNELRPRFDHRGQSRRRMRCHDDRNRWLYVSDRADFVPEVY